LKVAEVGNRAGVPPMSKLTNSGEYILYKLQPSWMRYGNFTENNVFHQIIPEV
jgi:hypothetical protein